MGSNSSRIIISVLIFLGIFILPWWLSVLFILIAFFIFESFYEGLFFGLMIDLLSSVSRELFYNLPVVSILLLFFFLLFKVLNKYLRMKN